MQTWLVSCNNKGCSHFQLQVCGRTLTSRRESCSSCSVEPGKICLALVEKMLGECFSISNSTTGGWLWPLPTIEFPLPLLLPIPQGPYFLPRGHFIAQRKNLIKVPTTKLVSRGDRRFGSYFSYYWLSTDIWLTIYRHMTDYYRHDWLHTWLTIYSHDWLCRHDWLSTDRTDYLQTGLTIYRHD